VPSPEDRAPKRQLLIEVALAGRTLEEVRRQIRQAGAKEVEGFAAVPDRDEQKWCFTVWVATPDVERQLASIREATVYASPRVGPVPEEED